LLRAPAASAELRCLVLVALYQLERTRAPDFAVVDSAVRTAEALRQPHAKGLVNAVLRGFLRRKAELEAALADDEVAQYGHAQWWIDQLKREYPEHWPAILRAGNGRPPMTLRVNARRASAEQYLRQLADANIAATLSGSTAVTVARPVQVGALPGFVEGVASVQDLAAQYAAPLLDAHVGMRVLDACAAPGGKAGHILELVEVDLLALDQDAARLQRVRQNLDRLGLRAELRAADAGEPAQWWDGVAFDRILLDVPCSGSGVVKRHPDIKWLRRVADIPQFAAQQARLLEAVWPCLSARGKLLYVSCSVFGAENNQQIHQFVAQHADARRLPIGVPGVETGPMLGQILPHESHDGFFYALLEKT
jgi:16S rRNA (cytosine967-C5)-methyltransferase